MPDPANHGDRWRPWRRASPELLARYVNIDAIAATVPADLFRTAEGASLHDLRSDRRLNEVARALYDGLSRLNIAYDLEPVTLDDPAGVDQKIRKPKEIVGHEGTCIELAVLYAGVCIKARLLPLILLLTSHAGDLHALVVLEGRDTLDDVSEPRGWSSEDRRLGFIQGKKNELLWRAPDGELWQRIVTGSYIAVECTGFAATHAHGPDRLRLSFDEARERATATLGASRAVATIDVVRLQKIKDYSAYVPEETVYRTAVDRYPDLADFMYDFTDLIESETAGFVGRGWVLDELSRFLSTTSAGYFCVVADAGLGKTALAADIASRYRAPAFFFSTTEGRTQIDECLRHLAVAAIARYELPHGHVPERAGRNWDFLRSVLQEASAKSAEPVLLVIDAIDEAAELVGTNPLFLPSGLPDRVHVVLTSRIGVPLQLAPTTALQSLSIAASDTRQATDIDLFLDSQLARPELMARLREHGYQKSAIAAQLKEASEGNFKYLSYVLRDLAQTDGDGLFPRLNTLPVGLTQYYEHFWSAMESAQNSGSWSDWNDLYRPTIALLAAAMEPVTVDWLSLFVRRPAAELRERALKRWIRFLRAEPRRDRWRIVHKSFADFLVEHHHVDVAAAHEQIADWYLKEWGTLDAGIPRLSAGAARDPIHAYGLRHIVEHLRETGDRERLRTLIDHPRWYAISLEVDPSGASYRLDLTQARAAAELDAANELHRRERPASLAREVTSAFSLASLNSLSYNLPAALLGALVECGHWTATTALAAARMNPEVGERVDAIAAIAPHLDGAVIEDALRIVRPLRSTKAHVALLRRLCTIASPERAVAEARTIVDDDGQATMLGALSDLLPQSLLEEVISQLQGLDARSDPRILSSQPPAEALAKAIGAAPPELLARLDDIGLEKSSARDQLLSAAARRWAELGYVDKSEGLAMRVANESLRGLLWAQFVPHVPAGDVATRSRLLDEFEAAAPDMFPLHRVDGVVAVAKYLDPRRLNKLIHEAWPDKKELGAERALSALTAILPNDMLEQAERRALEYDREYGREEALVPLGVRFAQLGNVDRAIEMVARIGDSYNFGSAMVRLLPRIAEFGHEERAVSEAIVLERRGRDQFVAPAIVGVSSYVSRPLLDRLVARARTISDYDDRRRALLGVAPRYVSLGDPAEAHRLARVIDDSDERLRFEAGIGMAWGQLVGDFDRALRELQRLPPMLRFQQIPAISRQLPAGNLLDAISALRGSRDDNGESLETMPLVRLRYRWALDAILGRVGALGFADPACDIILARRQHPGRAWPTPPGDDDQLASVVHAVAEGATNDELNSALAEVMPFVREASLRHAEAVVGSDTGFGATKLRRSIALRYAALSFYTDALRIATGRDGKDYVTLGSLAPTLDADGVRAALRMVVSDSDYLQVECVPALFARLAELELWDEAIREARNLKHNKVALKAIGEMIRHAGAERLDELQELAQQKVRAQGGPGIDVKYWAGEVDAARAARVAALGDPERAMEIARALASSYLDSPLSTALTGAAPSLSGALLDSAIEESRRLENKNFPELQAAAVSALLLQLSKQGLDGLRRALRLACDLPDPRVRSRALDALVFQLTQRPTSDVHDLWLEPMHVLSNRTRRHLFSDMNALLPIIVHLGGGAALDGVTRAVREVVARWP